MARKPKPKKTIATLAHEEATRRNIPAAEYQSIMQKDEQSPIRIAYERRNRDLDPQLVWGGKDEQDGADLVVHAPPLYIQEKVHPKVLIDDLLRRTCVVAGKGNKQRKLYLGKESRQMVRPWLDARGKEEGYLFNPMRKALKSIG